LSPQGDITTVAGNFVVIFKGLLQFTPGLMFTAVNYSFIEK